MTSWRGWCCRREDAGECDALALRCACVRGLGGQRYALIIDQFEEIITAHPGRWHEREGFFRQLNPAMQADPNLWVVLTLREDYVAALDPYAPLLADRLRARFLMEHIKMAGRAGRRPQAGAS